jgi:hypothetical protein
MTRQFEGEACAICRAYPSSRKGEHVLPLWLKSELWPQKKGEYRSWVRGEPVMNRYDQPREDDSWSINLPVCKGCNNVLNQNFELCAQRPVRALMVQDGNVVLSGDDAMVVARWFLKTWLLWAHPAARMSVPDIAPPRWDGVTDDLYTWMVTDQRPPAGLSIWATKRGKEEPEAGATRYIPLPTVVADGRRIEFRVKRASLRWLDVSLVYHPGWEIDHPLETEGRALRLWPRAADTEADFAALPAIHARDTVWLKGPTIHFIPGAFERGNLPALAPSFNPIGLGPQLISRIGWSGDPNP